MARIEDEFNFETIAKIYREERNSTGLTKLPLHFYTNLINYTDKLRKLYFEERKNDPSSSKTIMLEDEFNKAQRRASQIYEYRERKIALLAISAANGIDQSTKLMTEEERIAFEKLVETLTKNRSNILLKKEEDACEAKTFLASDQKEIKDETQSEAADVSNTITEEESEKKEESELGIDDIDKENPVLLILEDIPSFETEERTFNLKRNDVISLPKEVAKILCGHKKARVIQDNKEITTFNGISAIEK